MTEPEQPITTIEPISYEVLRLYPTAGGGEPILRMDVQDGQVVAHYAPDDLDAAARILVDELVRRFRSHLDATRQVDVDQVTGVLEQAAAGVEPGQWQDAIVVPIPVAAAAIADMLAVRRDDA